VACVTALSTSEAYTLLTRQVAGEAATPRLWSVLVFRERESAVGTRRKLREGCQRVRLMGSDAFRSDETLGHCRELQHLHIDALCQHDAVWIDGRLGTQWSYM